MNPKYALPFLLACLLALGACDREARMASQGFRLYLAEEEENPLKRPIPHDPRREPLRPR